MSRDIVVLFIFYQISEVNTTSCERVPQDDLDSSLPSLIPNYFGAWRRSAPYTIAEFFSDHFYNSKLLSKPFVLIEPEETRTPDTVIKSHVFYQLNYKLLVARLLYGKKTRTWTRTLAKYYLWRCHNMTNKRILLKW